MKDWQDEFNKRFEAEFLPDEKTITDEQQKQTNEVKRKARQNRTVLTSYDSLKRAGV